MRRHGGDVGAVEQNAPGGGFLEAGDQPQRRGLPASRRPEQRKELAAGNRQVDIVDGGMRRGTVSEPLVSPTSSMPAAIEVNPFRAIARPDPR
jgi:hypothetical protein